MIIVLNFNVNFKKIIAICFVVPFNTAISQNDSINPDGTLVTEIKVHVQDKIQQEHSVSNVMSSNCCSPKCDYLRMFDAGVVILKATIFDRWGEKVAEVGNPHPLSIWKGEDSAGNPCKEGVYFYLIELKNKLGKEASVKGNVVLFR